MIRIVAQVRDGSYGQNAAGVHASLAHASGADWATIAEAETRDDGCIEDWDTWHLERGLYRIVFDSGGYFAGLGVTTSYPEVAVVFRTCTMFAIFQVQVTLAPYSYSTYFGTLDGRPEGARLPRTAPAGAAGPARA
jgi:5-hydroxyisourate hydrolase